MNENENAAGKHDEKTETDGKDDVTMAKDTPVQEGEGIIIPFRMEMELQNLQML